MQEGEPIGRKDPSKGPPVGIITSDNNNKNSNTVDNKNNNEGSSSSDTTKAEDPSFRHARTPKHANKTMSLMDDEERRKDGPKPQSLDFGERNHQGGQYGGPYYRPGYSSQRPPPPGGASGNFSPRDTAQYSKNYPSQYYGRGRDSMPTVSPGGGNDYRQNPYYNNNRDDYHRPPSSWYHPPPQDAPAQPQNYRHGEHDQHYSNYPPSYSGPQGGGAHYPPNTAYGGYQQQDSRYGGYTRPPHYPHPPRPDYGRHTPAHEAGRYPDQQGNFTRAVSSSFDRSVKSRTDTDPKHDMRRNNKPDVVMEASNQDGNGSVAASDDFSWRQLNQVESIDEAALQDRVNQKKEKRDEKARNVHISQEPSSNSSSLTNSPSESGQSGTDRPPLPTPSKLAALDSLSSLASGQAPMDTQSSRDGKKDGASPTDPPSPGSSTASLDLMKCHSGSSGLLHGFPGPPVGYGEYKLDNKRSREARGDIDTKNKGGRELRRAPSGDDKEPFSKKRRGSDAEKVGRMDDKSRAKSSDIVCSPPGSPATDQQAKVSRSRGHDKNNSPSYFDKPPSYTYSLESAPSFPRNESRGPYPPPRPGSSASSNITPMVDVGGPEGHRDGVGPSLPSWDLQPQDSFGNGSLGGSGSQLMANFSFSHDYPMLSASESNLGFNGPSSSSSGNGGAGNPAGRDSQPTPVPREPHHPPPPQHNRRQHAPPPPSVAESRNQSFDGHYHGYNRSDSMDAYDRGGHRQSGPPPPGYKPPMGPYPPHAAASWGTTISAGSHHATQYRHPPGPHYGPYNPRNPPPHSPLHHPYRMYSEDTRTSPPPGARTDFRPPPEFAAPHNPHLSRRPPTQTVYIMSSPAGANESNMVSKSRAGGGIYSWTKDDDMRLTEVMKKYKNPRDWEPIAKEHGRGKSAKECHERWIRYLKPGVRKGQWQDHEDAIVVEAVTTSTEQPFTRWSDLAQRLPGRVGKQIRDRWVNHLNPNINHLPFSREDDLLLWDGHKKLGKRWVEISTKFFNSTRSENHIKNRWYSAAFKKFIANEFGPDAYSGGSSSSKQSPFTRDEDVTLWEAHKEMGNRWGEIRTRYFNSARSESELKSRWSSTGFKKFVGSKYGPDAYGKGKAGRDRSKSKKDTSKTEMVESV